MSADLIASKKIVGGIVDTPSEQFVFDFRVSVFRVSALNHSVVTLYQGKDSVQFKDTQLADVIKAMPTELLEELKSHGVDIRITKET